MPARNKPKTSSTGEPSAPGIAEPQASPAATAASAAPADNVGLLDDVEMSLAIELGRHAFTLDQALRLGEQSLVELDKSVGDPVDVLVNGKVFARGEVVTVGAHFGVRLTEIVGRV